MVIGVFPFLKLGVLFVKQISKPLAQVIVNQAKNHHIFRTYFIIPPAQFYHWAEVKTKMYLMNLGKPTKVAKLNETMAIELGASLMGEVIIFSVAGACIVLEYNRQVAKEAKKEEARLAQLNKFNTDIEALQKSMAAHDAEIRYLHTLIEELAKDTKHKLPARSILENNPLDISQASTDTPVKRNESTTAQDDTKIF
ncbi:optic atrophy 3 protein homolog isoform X2 [Cephus cinctus]|uniref:Optic atrophy 3 protein homolog isoform X2 n=1 Tax=Cephus cinctus TaxID=211228 RepID=A0AAJ7RJL9_CEPCN|nr:optic atrophy 3 protein homolog isoform X2 [Cephus cinctus]